MSEPTDKDDKDFEFPDLHAEENPTASEPGPEEPKPARAPNPTVEKIKHWIINNKRTALLIGFIVVAGAMWSVKTMRGSGELDPEKFDASANAPDEIPVNAIEAKLGRFQDTINAVRTLKGEAEIE